MKFFIDSADLGEIRELAATGLVDGVTTNPSLVAKSGRKFFDVLQEICAIVACRALAGEGTMVNVTLCFSSGQAILAAKAGASFISPFIGRLDDIAQPGMELIRDIVAIYRQYPAFKTEVLVASVRNPLHVIEAARLGAHVATLPPAVLRQLFVHPLTEKGLAQFLADWAKTGQSILGHEQGPRAVAKA